MIAETADAARDHMHQPADGRPEVDAMPAPGPDRVSPLHRKCRGRNGGG